MTPSTGQVNIPAIVAPSPTGAYDPENEAQFRRGVEAALQALSAAMDQEIIEEEEPAQEYALLARVEYNPGTSGTVAAGGTLADVDATNLAVAFTAPASGKVVVVLKGILGILGGTTNPGVEYDVFWGVREGTTNITSLRVWKDHVPDPDDFADQESRFCVTTPVIPNLSGAYTWKWAHYDAAASASAYLRRGGVHGPATMEVWGVP